jgi:hypothetical protein
MLTKISPIEDKPVASVERLAADDLPKTLYHYCSLSSFFGIVSSRNVRLSCQVATNDFLECSWIDTILKKMLNDMDIDTAFLRDVIHQYNSRFARCRANDVYLSCFSEDPDRLSQWRSYADDGRGVAVGFSTQNAGFADLVGENKELTFGKVIYNDDQQMDIIKDILLRHYAEHDPDSDLQTAVVLCARDFRNMAPLLKNKAFCEEKEWRLIYRPDIHPNILGELKLDSSHLSAKFMVRGSGLYPFFEFPFSNGFAISDVIIGPKNIQDRSYIELFLHHHGFKPNINDSEASYR